MSIYTMLVQTCVAGLLGQLPADHCCPCPPTANTRPVAWWAIPSDTGGFALYRVGGGCPAPLRADAPTPCEGTWGWDYVGHLFRRDVILGWWHGRRDQGGTGAYRTDGPTLHDLHD